MTVDLLENENGKGLRKTWRQLSRVALSLHAVDAARKFVNFWIACRRVSLQSRDAPMPAPAGVR
jgi:hypothetical protein